MKKMKISLAAIAIVIAVSLSAFTTRDARLTGSWFTIVNTAHPELASSYNYYGASSPCAGNDVLCAINGSRDPNNMSLPLQSDVNSAKSASGNFSHHVTGQVDFKAN